MSVGLEIYAYGQAATAALRRCPSNPMPITVPNYNGKTDRHHFGIVIKISSER
jgi:hypothetical protein